MALVRAGAVALERRTCRAFSSQRLAMLIDGGDQSRVTCVCVVDGVPAGFQIDCGSTFSHIAPELAPPHVPRHGLGSASCLGRRLWFPTCEVQLAPVDPEGRIVQLGGVQERLTTRVQVGRCNLLGLHELRRWRVEVSFAPEAHHCSMHSPAPLASPEVAVEAETVQETLPLAEALRAAAALNEGLVTPEEACCSQRPWLLDASKVIAALRRQEEGSAPPTMPTCTWSGFSFPGDALIAECIPTGVARVPPLGLVRSVPVTADVLFGTADALLSSSEIPPLLPPSPVPLLEWTPV